MAGYNFADVWEVCAKVRPDDTAQIHGERRVTWGEMDARADGIARALLDAGLGPQAKVAQYLYNGPEYMESVFASFKASCVPVNTNYRYREDEIVYLWDNADVEAVVFHATFTELIERVRDRTPNVKLWLWVDDGAGPCPGWATPYEDAAAAASGRTVPPQGRSGDDILLLYTGGTTGMPKGVMWRQADLYATYNNSLPGPQQDPTEEPDLDAVRQRFEMGPGPVYVPACPMMHGTGMFVALAAMRLGGAVVSLTSRSYDPRELLDAIHRERVNMMAIVGDPFARPMLEALDAEPDRWDISSLLAVISSGAVWSAQVKQGLLRHHPHMVLSDHMSSSEALGMARSDSTGDTVAGTASFQLGENARVITDDGRDVTPGSGEIGVLAVGGLQPVGYYKDPEKSARTFREIDGKRFSIPGDYATVEADGTIRLMGRGNAVINTGGEKVFPEEVEEAIKEHPAVTDVLVVGIPDPKFGQAVTGVVATANGDPSEDELIAHVKERLAGYKAPKRVVFVDRVPRTPSGKADYTTAKQAAAAELGVAVEA